MACPTYSSDLNPIENFWDSLNRAVSSRLTPPTTLIELETALQEEWRLLDSAVVDHHLIESMINLRLILVSGKTREYLFSPNDSASDIAQYVFDNWAEGKILLVLACVFLALPFGFGYS
ncbi:transposable element Tcb2 transposase [Trichonephila clavipes]|uniref:Transposable element Tcb2 transposase n=1 Tax=Trichonephila clavipes TaxID=2585209 RepID=A0A8X7B7I1_TRICX|nr:transposable element Tcb2 transposase [Trichonephila clavipes]